MLPLATSSFTGLKMTSIRFFHGSKKDIPTGAPSGLLPPGLQLRPIRRELAPASRLLTLSLTTLTVGLIAGGSAYFSIQAYRTSLLNPQSRMQLVRLLLDEGGDGEAAAPALTPGGGQNQALVEHPLMEAMAPMHAMAPRTDDQNEALEPLVPPEQLPKTLPELLSLHPGLLSSSLPGQGSGIGGGLGSEMGNGLGRGLAHGRGTTWIHSIHGDERLDYAVSFLDLKDYIPPVYPEGARAERVQGDVVISVTIDAAGKPLRWSVVEGHPLLVKATMKVFPKWRFVSPVHNGEKVGATFDVRLRFTLM